MNKFGKILLSIICSATILVACGNDNNVPSGTDAAVNQNQAELTNGLIVTMNSINLKDKYGDLVATAETGALVIDLSIENTADKETSFGTSSVTLYVGDEYVLAELLSGGERAIRYFDTIPVGGTLEGELLFGVPANISAATEEVKLVFTDVIGNETGSIKLDVTNLEKEDSTPKVSQEETTTGIGAQSAEIGGVKVTVSNFERLTDEEAKAKHPDVSGLSRGYEYVLLDISIENNSGGERAKLNAFNFALDDEYGDRWTAKNVYGRDLIGAMDTDTPILDGETRTGKIMFMIKDDITQLTFSYAPLYPEDKTRIEMELL
jgi:Telomeric repeat-binding factor 2.